MPADLFDWPPTIIDGVPIRTLSPLALIQIRAGATVTGVFGPARPGKDVASRLASSRRSSPMRAESLAPRVARWRTGSG